MCRIYNKGETLCIHYGARIIIKRSKKNPCVFKQPTLNYIFLLRQKKKHGHALWDVQRKGTNAIARALISTTSWGLQGISWTTTWRLPLWTVWHRCLSAQALRRQPEHDMTMSCLGQCNQLCLVKCSLKRRAEHGVFHVMYALLMVTLQKNKKVVS